MPAEFAAAAPAAPPRRKGWPAVAWLVIRIVGSATTRLEVEMARGSATGAFERLKRAQTLGALVRNVAVTLIAGIALLMVLRELNVDVVPMLRARYGPLVDRDLERPVGLGLRAPE